MHHNESSTKHPVSTNSFMISSQPWWRGIGHDSVSGDMLVESIGNISSPGELINSGLGTKTRKSQVKNGMDGGTDANKEMLITMASQADGTFGEQQPPQHTPSPRHPPLGEYFAPPTQLELVGHSIACASYPYSDSYYGGAVPVYGLQALSQCVGVHYARMALPLETVEEPVYVNAKQYHGILRRRQLRAKAEVEKKLIKVRKPYLHESRHLHAMRRARGCGGRFVNTKKLDSQATTGMAAKGNGCNVSVSTQPKNSSGSESMAALYSRSADSSTVHGEVTEPMVQLKPKERYSNGSGQAYSDGNGNGCYPHHQGFQQFKYRSVSDNKVEKGDLLSGSKGERIAANRARQGHLNK